VLGCACVCCVGCNGQLSPQAKELLLSSYSAYERGDDRATIRYASMFLKDNARSRRADEAHYLRGLAKYRTKDAAGAKEDLNAALDGTKNQSLRGKALTALGDLAYDADDMALAEQMFRQALAYIEPGKKPGDHAHYRLGCVLQRQGRWRAADLEFDRLIEQYRRSDLVPLASRRTHAGAWTVQAGVYQAKARADKAAAALSAHALPARAEPIPAEDELRFVVRVGRYPTYAQAVRMLPKVKRHVGDAFVFPAR